MLVVGEAKKIRNPASITQLNVGFQTDWQKFVVLFLQVKLQEHKEAR